MVGEFCVIMKKINYIPQVDESDCGVAALAMILSNYGTKLSLTKLRNMAKTNTEGTTALGIVYTAQNLNFTAVSIRADLNLFNKKDIPYPFIAHVIKKENIHITMLFMVPKVISY